MKYLILMLFLFGCTYPSKKPFIIIYKNYNTSNCSLDGSCYYKYIDAEGVEGSFCDTIVYKIGDLIE